MNLRSETGKRAQNAGFTLLEAVLAMAAIALILGSAYAIMLRPTQRQADLLSSYDMAAMARAILDEYIVTYPQLERSGTYQDRWRWTITEQPQAPLQETDFNKLFEFVRVSVQVQEIGAIASQPYWLDTVLARKAAK